MVTVTASIGTVTSNNLGLTVTKAAPALTSLALSGSPSLTYSGTPVTYDLSGLTLAGKDQYGAAFSYNFTYPGNRLGRRHRHHKLFSSCT